MPLLTLIAVQSSPIVDAKRLPQRKMKQADSERYRAKPINSARVETLGMGVSDSPHSHATRLKSGRSQARCGGTEKRHTAEFIIEAPWL